MKASKYFKYIHDSYITCKISELNKNQFPKDFAFNELIEYIVNNKDPNKLHENIETFDLQNINNVVALQNTLNKNTLNKYLRKPDTVGYVRMFKFGKYYLLINGHHRLAAAIELGFKTITVDT